MAVSLHSRGYSLKSLILLFVYVDPYQDWLELEVCGKMRLELEQTEENFIFRKVVWCGDEFVLSSPKNRLYGLFVTWNQIKAYVHLLK